MPVPRPGMAVMLGLATAAITSPSAIAATTWVNVQLMDHSEGGTLSDLGIVLDHQKVQAGRVIFQVTNMSKTLVHEMVVMKVGSREIEVPYSPGEDRVEEDKMNHLGEVSDLRPGGHETLTMTLHPGSYMLLCNQPGHFHAGMWTLFAVAP